MLESQDSSESPPQSKITVKPYVLAVATLLFFQGVQAFRSSPSTLPVINLAVIVIYITGWGFVRAFIDICGDKANAFLTRHNEPILFPAQTGKDPNVRVKCLGLLLLHIAVLVYTAVMFPRMRAVMGGMGVGLTLAVVMIGLAIGGYVYRIVARKRKQEEGRMNVAEEGTLLDKGGNLDN